MTLQRVILGRPRRAIDFLSCEEVVNGLASICHGWDIEITQPSTNGTKPHARVQHRGGNWLWSSFGTYKPRNWVKVPPRSTMRVLTDVQEALLHWHLDSSQHVIGLHAAGVEIGGKLVCFPARGFSGKSTLMATLARRGHKVFGDDVIMISKGGHKASSFGFSPRLRLPYPDNLNARTLKFIRARANPAGHGWAYVNTGAALGETCPIGSIVLLERESSGRARLEPAAALESLKAMLAEHLPGRQPLKQVFDCMKRVVTEASCYRLTYSRADDAAAVLVRELS